MSEWDRYWITADDLDLAVAPKPARRAPAPRTRPTRWARIFRVITGMNLK
jgi:hypothetical protein